MEIRQVCIKELTGEKIELINSWHKIKSRNIHNKKEEILQIWNEYVAELITRRPAIHKNIEGPEIRSAVEKNFS